MKRTEKIKQHFRENKKIYTACGITFVITALSTIVVTQSGPKTVVSKFHTQQTGVINKTTNLEVYIEALGDPGNIIQDTVSGTIYASQGQAARELGLEAARISEQLTGKRDHVNGHTFEKLGKAPVAG